MPERMLVSINESAKEIAETMLFVELVPGEGGMERCTLGADVSAVIGYSAALRGSLRLAGPVATVLKLAASLIGEERSVMDKEIEDAFAELANMVAGGVQTRLEGELGMIRMSPPVVISGKNHQVSGDRSFACVSQQFEIDASPFFIEIYFSRDCFKGEGANKEAAKSDDKAHYGFALTVPLPFTEGFEGEGSDIDVGNKETVASSPLTAEELMPAVVEGVKELFQLRLTQLAENAAKEMVRKMLPEVAERLVREEIERIKQGM